MNQSNVVDFGVGHEAEILIAVKPGLKDGIAAGFGVVLRVSLIGLWASQTSRE